MAATHLERVERLVGRQPGDAVAHPLALRLPQLGRARAAHRVQVLLLVRVSRSSRAQVARRRSAGESQKRRSSEAISAAATRCALSLTLSVHREACRTERLHGKRKNVHEDRAVGRRRRRGRSASPRLSGRCAGGGRGEGEGTESHTKRGHARERRGEAGMRAKGGGGGRREGD